LLFAQPGMVPAPFLENLIEQIQKVDMADVRRKVEEEEKQQAEAKKPGLIVAS